MYSVYILCCSDDTLYTGITTDLTRRLYEHNHSSKGAKYTHSRRPLLLVYHESVPDRSTALKREGFIKSLTREQKLALISDHRKE